MILISESKEENKIVEELAKTHHGRAIMREDGYAMTIWSVNDVVSNRDVSPEQAEAFLEDYERRLAESAISGGWDFIEYADMSEYTTDNKEDEEEE